MYSRNTLYSKLYILKCSFILYSGLRIIKYKMCIHDCVFWNRE